MKKNNNPTNKQANIYNTAIESITENKSWNSYWSFLLALMFSEVCCFLVFALLLYAYQYDFSEL